MQGIEKPNGGSPMDAASAITVGKGIMSISEKIGILQTLKNKFIGDPQQGANKLTVTLLELQKIFIAFESEIVRFLAINFDPANKEQLRKDKQILIEFEGGSISARMDNARGRCGKIGNIHDTYLSPWFRNLGNKNREGDIQALTDEEVKSLENLFLHLSNADGEMVKSIEEIEEWLTEKVKKVSNLIKKEKFEEANKLIEKARIEILPSRKLMNKAVQRLFAIEAEIIERLGTT